MFYVLLTVHLHIIVEKKNQLDAQLILSIFRQPLRVLVYLGPSRGGTTVCIQQLVVIILFM
jgi:uncharacterized membrane protein YheB (UPF0754 family)